MPPSNQPTAESGTPRTDKETFDVEIGDGRMSNHYDHVPRSDGSGDYVTADFARHLESETSALQAQLDAANSEVARLRADLLKAMELNESRYAELTNLKPELAVASTEIERQKRILNELELHAPPTPEEWHRVNDSLNAAIAQNEKLREALEELLSTNDRLADLSTPEPDRAWERRKLAMEKARSVLSSPSLQREEVSDTTRLDGLCEYLNREGAKAFLNIPWTLYDDAGESLMDRDKVSEDEVDDIRLDRPAIDRFLSSPATNSEKKGV